MEVARSLSIKDFFNYYFAGVIWLLDLAILLLTLSDLPAFTTSLQTVRSTTDLINPIILAILAVSLPYIVGFTLNPMGSLLSLALRRIFGDAKDWITDYGSHKHKGKRLRQSLIKAIVQHAQEAFGEESILEKNLNNWFFDIRAYVTNVGGSASDLATRALDLANLAESLLLPVPLFFVVLGTKLVGQAPWMAVLIWIAALVSIGLLIERYLKLREYWAKHIYRAFLVISVHKAD
jgi:hypothetical protein